MLWNLQKNIKKINKKLMEDLPIADLPTAIKLAFAKGTIYKLTETNGTYDYIGPCINLASRLIKYCKEINFIVSARIDLSKKEIQDNGYFRIIAKDLRSFEREIVLIDKNDYEKISAADKKRLFEEI